MDPPNLAQQRPLGSSVPPQLCCCIPGEVLHGLPCSSGSLLRKSACSQIRICTGGQGAPKNPKTTEQPNSSHSVLQFLPWQHLVPQGSEKQDHENPQVEKPGNAISLLPRSDLKQGRAQSCPGWDQARAFPYIQKRLKDLLFYSLISSLTSERRAFHFGANVKVPSPRTLNLFLKYGSCYNAVKKKASTKLLNRLKLFLVIWGTQWRDFLQALVDTWWWKEHRGFWQSRSFKNGNKNNIWKRK